MSIALLTRVFQYHYNSYVLWLQWWIHHGNIPFCSWRSFASPFYWYHQTRGIGIRIVVIQTGILCLFVPYSLQLAISAYSIPLNAEFELSRAEFYKIFMPFTNMSVLLPYSNVIFYWKSNYFSYRLCVYRVSYLTWTFFIIGKWCQRKGLFYSKEQILRWSNNSSECNFCPDFKLIGVPFNGTKYFYRREITAEVKTNRTTHNTKILW